MDTRFFDEDAEAGIREYFHFDPVTGGGAIETVQDLTDIVELAKAHYNSTDERARFDRDINHVAIIPTMMMAHELKRRPNEATYEHQRRCREWANNPDNKVFRTRPGRV